MIDRHNRTRQDDLEIERQLGTHNWATRVNMSIFGMEVVDTFLVHNAVSGRSEDPNTFFSYLAEEMIDNTFDT